MSGELDPVIFIVKQLNEVFKQNLSLVDFDEKSALEVFQILNDVLAEISESVRGDVRDEEVAPQMTQLLHMLKYKGEVSMEKEVMYPILHWLLERLPLHKKRAYVAKFLYPIEVPIDYLSTDEAVSEKYSQYKQLQEEFKRAHKEAEAVRREPVRPFEIKTEMTSLSDEKKQLEIKIEKLEKQNADTHDFETLLKATRALRLQQDEDARLSEKMRKQTASLQNSEVRKRDTAKRLETLRQSTSASQILAQLEEEVGGLENKVLRELPRQLDEIEARRAGASRTKEDVAALESQVEEREAKVQGLRKRVDEESSKNTSKLVNYKSHVSMMTKKVENKETEIDELRQALRQCRADLEKREASMAPTNVMTRDEFRAFGAQLREKTHVYKKLKAELAAARHESVTLHRTEQILRGRVANLEVFLSELEARRGVSGFRETQSKIEQTASKTSEADQIKEHALDEISETVRQITAELRDKKKDLAPQIKKLRDVRTTYQAVEADFLAKKSTYDKVAVSLDVERHDLERECDAYQDEALREESRFHYLNCLIQLAESTLKRVNDEEAWKQGKGRGLLPNFKSYEALYANKLAQQQAFSDQLRKQRAHVDKNQGPAMEQRSKFADLDALLKAKIDHPDLSSSAEFQQIGGANIFQLAASTSSSP
ncbi:hypothetical protein CTAYLR_004126 [Chrysophaeum taylorii]|uniref:IFT81 calponin homology domain-containing protein n=1 Tax=Chrysophaeum taylorii TaxID=2483200 RepID=A0AAD7UCV1_9STRA|nr:hypothetical protein CTAYLR_004126 [Chrysophaeum taylorii]